MRRWLNLLSLMIINYVKYNKGYYQNSFKQTLMPYSRLFSETSLEGNSKKFTGYTSAEAKRDAYSIAKRAPIEMPAIILVSPFLDRNVGSVSRAMLNFGMSELRLVDPK